MLPKSQVKYIQSLGHKKFRDETNSFVAEGPKIVSELIISPFIKLIHLYAVKEWISHNQSVISSLPHGTFTELNPHELESVSFLSTPNQVLAVFNKPDFSSTLSKKGIFLLLNNIQDPGNMGSLVRIADWFGISQVICDLQTADLYNPKVVQATMGSISRIPVSYLPLPEFITTHREIPLFATVLDGTDLRQLPKIDHGMILIGNESRGIDSSLLNDHPDIRKISITRKGGAESLNAAVAAGIVLSHLVQ
jgi:RNA methyltransferase, TrmH family